MLSVIIEMRRDYLFTQDRCCLTSIGCYLLETGLASRLLLREAERLIEALIDLKEFLSICSVLEAIKLLMHLHMQLTNVVN